MEANTNGTTTNGTAAPSESTELAPTRRPLEFEAQNVDDVWRMATMLSKSNLIPDALIGKPNDVLVTLLAGRELGLSSMQSLRLIYVVKGRPYISSQLKIARVKQSPECIYLRCVETTGLQATFETERKGEGVTRLTFTAEEAKQAGLLGRQTKSGEPDNWMKYTALMLRWRAASQLCDMVYPDVVGGLGTHEELEDQRRADHAARVYAPDLSTPAAAALPEKVVGAGATAKAAVPVAASKPSLEEARQAAGAITSTEVKDHTPAPVRQPGEDDDEATAQTSAVSAIPTGPHAGEVELEKAFADATKVGELLKHIGKINALPESLRAKWQQKFTERREELVRASASVAK